MSGYYMRYLESLCRRCGWEPPSYECYRDPSGYTCLVLVNGREYQTDLVYESSSLAQENAAMRAFMICRNFSVNGGMLARNGIVQAPPVNDSSRRKKSRHTSTSHAHTYPYSDYGSGESSSSGGSGGSATTASSGSSLFSRSVHSFVSMASSLLRSGPSTFSPEQKVQPSMNFEFEHALSTANTSLVYTLLQNSFADIAIGEYEWLTELQSLGYSPTEIADILLEKSRDGPCVFAKLEIPGVAKFVDGFHQEGCVHSGLVDTDTESHLRILKEAQLGTEGSEHGSASSCEKGTGTSLAPVESIGYFCGVGGVKPTYTGNTELLFGSLSFEDDNSTAISALHDDGVIEQVLADVERAAGTLQQLQGCCDSFSFLWQQTSCAELVSIDLETLRCLYDITRENPTLRSLEKFIPNFFDETLQSRALAAQFFSLAFLSYSQAHCGSLRPFFLDTPLNCVILTGTQRWTSDFEGPCIVGSLVELSCFGTMLHQPVFAFQYFDQYDREIVLERRLDLDLLASPEDVLDAWGPGGFMAPKGDNENLYAISVGGGLITPVSTDPGSFHWSPTARLDPQPTVTFHRKTKIRIGAKVSSNDNCRANPQEQLRLAFAMLGELGTFPSYWEVSERQLGLGLQAGQSAVALLQFNQTWVKRHGMTKKSRLLAQKALYLSDLKGYFGIQVSVCTGIARRIRLRELLSDILPAYVGSLVTKPPRWKSLLDSKILEILKEGDLAKWLESLDYDLQKTFENLVMAILFILQDTGVDRKGENFIVGCIQPDMPFQCFTIPCRRENYWARMVADSEDIATFAYVTTTCLETDVVKCRGSKAHWANSTTLLWTAVSCYEERILGTSSTLSPPVPWTLKHSEAYLIGKPEAPLLVRVERVNNHQEPRLLVSVSMLPSDILLRLYRRAGSKKLRRLREKGAFNQKSENVVVLASIDGRPR
ncbi:hypothetical protein GGR51DRAFT_503546 [Nemania sp. FL0031]|nr:hypothetical protein GGR51DRAFT_503546 [Nemania sp. FL0031]